MRAFSKASMLGAAVHAAVLAIPFGASAEVPDPPVAVVYLRSGQTARGTLVELTPDGQARLKLDSGEAVTIPRPEIMRIEHEPGPPGTTEILEGTPVSPSMAWVRLEGTSHVRLEWDPTGRHDWKTACFAPCDRRLPTSAAYRVAGDGMKSSSDFWLEASEEPDVLTVHLASTTWFDVGMIALGAGALVATFGVDVTLLQSVTLRGEATYPGATLASWVVMGAGAAVAVAGLLIALSNARTTVSQARGSTPRPLAADSLKLRPMWRAPEGATAGLPMGLGLPIFYTKF